MSEQQQRYMVSVYESDDANDVPLFTLGHKELPQERRPEGLPQPVSQFIVAVSQADDGLSFDWSGTADDPGAAREEIESEIHTRLQEREVWIDRVTALVDQVEQWGVELGWSTRRVNKTLDDARIGKHRVPALLMQEDTCRILLEPVGRSTPGAEGAVELYLMPAYDDIAAIYYYDNQWHLHYLFPATQPVATVREGEALPLSKEALARALLEMRQHAA